MKTEQVIKLVDLYSKKFRAANLKDFLVGSQYNLFPIAEENLEFIWPKQWQFCGNSGIYLFINEDNDVIYIGETTHFGNRFGSYFSNDNGKCYLKHQWNLIPKYVIPIKVPDDSSFERLALEEYLIKLTKPGENKRFNY